MSIITTAKFTTNLYIFINVLVVNFNINYIWKNQVTSII